MGESVNGSCSAVCLDDISRMAFTLDRVIVVSEGAVEDESDEESSGMGVGER